MRQYQDVSAHSAGYVWYVIGLLSVVNVFNYMDRMALSVLLPSIQADMHLSDTQIGLLAGLAFSLFYALCGLPIARLADHGVRRNIIALALAIWSVMTALSGAAQNFWQLFLARMGIGASEAGGLPPAQSILCDYVPLERRSGVFSVHVLGLAAGMMLGMALAGWLGEIIGWRWTLVALGLPGLALSLVVRFTLREPVRGSLDTVKSQENVPSFAVAIKALGRCRTFRLLMIAQVMSGITQNGLAQWMPTFYTRTLGLSMSSTGIYLGVAKGVGLGIGLIVGGMLGNKLAKRDSRLPLMMAAAGTFLMMPILLASLFVDSASQSIFLVGVAGIFDGVASGPILAVMFSIVGAQMRATAGAVNVFFTSAIGFTLGPFCVGWLSDFLAPSLGVEALRYALLVPIGLVPIMVIALYGAAQALPNDLQETKRTALQSRMAMVPIKNFAE